MRTRFDPLKWPILDAADNSFIDSTELNLTFQLQSEIMLPEVDDFCPVAMPLSRIPIPPTVPHIVQTDHIIPILEGHSETGSISSSISEILNPDVPEFIPTEITGNNIEMTATNENEETKNENQFEKLKDVSISLSNIVTSLNDNPAKENNKSRKTEGTSISASLSEKQENERPISSSDNTWQEVNYLLIFNAVMKNKPTTYNCSL